MLRSLLLILLIYPAVVNAAQTVQFHYDPNDGGGALTCNGKQMGKPPIDCNYDASGKLHIERANWGGEALLEKDSPITGDCAKSLIGKNDSYNLTPNCLPGSGNTGNNTSTIKKATGAVILDEWYTDLPWNQKLSTKDSNLIKAPFVLPYAALDPSLCRANSPIEKSRCMLQYGIVNVMAMHRTDTLYNSGEAPKGQDCDDNNCVEVKIRIQRLHTNTRDQEGYAADIVRNNPHTHNSPELNGGVVPSLGFAVNEATIFAPWRPWYMGHYCAKDADNKADAVCYEDYFTTQLIAVATTANNEVWLKDNPGVMEPHGREGIYLKYCKEGLDYCDMYLGKVDWMRNATAPMISECGSDPVKTCMKEVNDKTRDLDIQFNQATDEYVDVGRYPWDDEPYFNGSPEEEIRLNPFIGYYELKKYSDNAHGIPPAPLFKATHYVLPKECTKDTYLGARHGIDDDIHDLEKCVLNFEIHTTGFHEQWKWLWGGKENDNNIDDISLALQGTDANQYGRTMFIYAGVPEQHIPVSFKMLKDGMSVYDKMYNASIYTQYLPMVNPADMTLKTKYYTDDFWHAILMSNHMNQTPDHFIRGIRGRTLWHNEYRSDILYKSATTDKYKTKNTAFENILNHVDFPAGFQEKNSTSPYHGNTCDSCHVRNGSGVPLMPNGKLPEIHVKRGMKHDYKLTLDYTYSNSDHKGRPIQVLPSMKIVFIDLNDTADSSVSCDDNNNSVPKYSPPSAGEYPPDRYYTNKIMNFYGNSLHVNQKGDLPTYNMEYVVIKDNDGFEVVDKTVRGKIQPVQKGGDFPYLPRRIKISNINVGTTCKNITSKPHNVDNDTWPATCNDVSGNSIEKAIETNKIGYIHLLGRRLGNTPMIEMIPDKTIQETQRAQASGKMQYAGCLSLAPGTRRGSNDNEFNYRSCTSGNYGTGDTDCYIGRWGWIGDRASLEDQIANAASVEMNVTSRESYSRVHPRASDPDQLVRYNQTLCGPADATCKTSHANSDITEQEIRDMATYQRWIGIPNRSEYQVTSEKVQAGEEVFRDLQCNSCHVIDKIAFEVDDNMLPDEERKHLETLQIEVNRKNDYPFISYLGTDLLLHDMGYLSQVAKAPSGVKIRDEHTGEVKKEYKNYVQRIRTPALKSLRFNRFVTDSNHNTKDPLKKGNSHYTPGCDFLLHDGRACDAIEATYLHDGPAIKELGTIKSLNELSATQLEQLRAFLYSL
jgi:hypothetical protein